MTKKNNTLVIAIAFIAIVIVLFVPSEVEYWRHSNDPKEVIEYQNIQVKEIIDIIYVDDVALVLYQAEGKEQEFSTKLLLHKDGEYQLIRDIELVNYCKHFEGLDGELLVFKHKEKYIIYTTVWGGLKDGIVIKDSESSKFEFTLQETTLGVYIISGLTVLNEVPEDYWIIIDEDMIFF